MNAQCASCKKLQKTWYKKLSDDDFEDIERHGKYEGMLKVYSSEFYSKDYPLEVRYAKQEYYQLATNFLEDYRFDKNLHKVIWEYHSMGISYRNIVKLLKSVKINSDTTSVKEIIQGLRVKLFDMYLLPKKVYRE